MVRFWARIAGAGFLVAVPTLAQGTGSIAGRVTDSTSGQPVPAEVVVDGVRTARADDRGAFQVDNVPLGKHVVRLRYPGFTPRDVPVDVVAGALARANATLEPAIVPLSAVVVTAARREQRLADAVVETELIGARELQRSGASDVAAAIADRTGIQVDGGVPTGAGVQIRGFDSRRVLVLVDGQPMTGRLNGNFDLSRLPLSAVDRIEVVKGPQSTLYGSDAMGGVINIITRQPPATNALTNAFTATLGSVGRREASVESGWRRDTWSATASGGYRGIDLTPGLAGDAGTFARRWDGMASTRWEPDSTHRFEVGGLVVQERQRYRTGQLFHFADNTQAAGHATAAATLAGGRWTGSLALSRFEHLSRASTGSRPVSDSGAADVQTLWQTSTLYSRPVGRSALDLGIDARQESIAADRVRGPVHAIHTIEPFAQYTASLGDIQLSPGARLTASDRWGSFVAPRLAVLWRPRPALALRAAVGRGFRAPDFKELYFDFVNTAAGYAVDGNPALKPEQSTSLSLGAEWDGARLYLHTSAFRNTYRNFIEFREPDATGTYTYGNIARGSTTGVEAEGGVFVKAWRVDASTAWMRTHDNASGLPLLGRPSTTLRLTADGPLAAGVRAALVTSWVGRTPVDRTAAGGTMERPSFLRIDSRLARPLSARVEAALGATNLLDRQLGVGWPGFTGRQIYLTLTWRQGNAP